VKYSINGNVTTVFWDRDCVIFHHDSGNTHLMADVPEVLLQRCLLPTPYDQDDLLRSIQQDTEFSEQEWSVYINQLLAILIKKDLIEKLN